MPTCPHHTSLMEAGNFPERPYPLWPLAQEPGVGSLTGYSCPSGDLRERRKWEESEVKIFTCSLSLNAPHPPVKAFIPPFSFRLWCLPIHQLQQSPQEHSQPAPSLRPMHHPAPAIVGAPFPGSLLCNYSSVVQAHLELSSLERAMYFLLGS